MAASVISSRNTWITGGTFNQYNNISKSTNSFDRLLDAASPAAFHNSNDRRDPPKCHPNTRVAVLQTVMDWIHGLDPKTENALIMWLHGAAGSGKSAIAQSIAELCYEEGGLLASYFFSRFDPTRNHPRSLIATIVYQISLYFPSVRDHLTAIINHDPLIFSRSLEAQLSTLLIDPLQEIIDSGYFSTPAAARLIIIDGLDECEDRQGQVEILKTVSKAITQRRLPLIFLVASRPEHDIRTTFDLRYLKDISTRNPLDDHYLPSEDIRLFLQDKFAEIKQDHPFRAQIPLTWPTDDTLTALVKKSSGQFIYASTVIKFVKSSRHRPLQRLDIILGIRPAQRDMPFAELDALYMHIFSSVVDPEPILQILGLQFLSGALPALEDMEILLSFGEEDFFMLLFDFASLVEVYEDYSRQYVQVLHASLQDFLLDKSRSHQFHIDAPLRHAEYAHLYFRHPKGQPKFWDDTMSERLGRHYNFFHHINHCAPTQELCDDLSKYSVIDFVMGGHSDIFHYFIPDFFASIKQWKVDNSTHLYSYQLQLFDQAAQGIMKNMYSDSSLTALVAITKLGRPGVTNVHMHQYEILTQLFKFNRAQGALDELHFIMMWGTGSYNDFIWEFLEDPARSGIYTLTGERYAVAAVHFLKHISSRVEQSQNSMAQWNYRTRRNPPWFWRKTGLHTWSAAARRIPVKLMIPIQRLQPKEDTPSPHPFVFHFAIRCLLFVLPRSDKSAELISLARRWQRICRVQSQKYPLRTRAVKQQIARYLARVEPGSAS